MTNTPSRLYLCLFVAIMVTGLAGCGQRGPLYLPTKPADVMAPDKIAPDTPTAPTSTSPVSK